MAARTARPSKLAKAAKAAPKPRRPTSPEAHPVEDELVNGQAVVRVEDVLSGLTHDNVRVKLRFQKITLADGTEHWRCIDCKHLANTRGEAQNHRRDEHPHPKTARRQSRVDDPIRDQVMAMPVVEVVELAISALKATDTIDEMRAELAKARERALEAEVTVNRFKAAMARLGFRMEDA